MSKYNIFDVIWMLNKVKKVTVTLEKNANPALTLHEDAMDFFTIRQVRTEAADDT